MDSVSIRYTRHSLPAETMSVRLVNLLDEAKRQELMFIYMEDMAANGASVAQLREAGSESKWQELKAALIGRATKDIKLEY